MQPVKKNLTEGNIKKQLIQLTWPMLIGMVGLVLFNLTDTFYVGKLGVTQLAAMSFTFPVVMFINGISQGLGIGATSLISRNVILKKRKELKCMASRAILLGFTVVIVVVVTGLLTIQALFSSLGAGPEVLGYIKDYMQIWYLGIPFVIFPIIGNNIVRATGDTFVPGMIMLSTYTANIIIDPLLIFGLGPFPEMGIKGAALATVIARSIGFMAIITILIKREKLITISFGKIKDILSTWKKILYIAAPASLTLLITPISLGIITRILSTFGEEAVAGFGVASKVEMFALMVIMALGSVLIIFTGQNYSKHKYNRIKSSLNYSMLFSLGWGALIFILLLVAGKQIASIFTDSRAVAEISLKYFLIIGGSYGFQGLVLLSTSAFNGLNKPLPSTTFSAVRMLIIYVPLAYIGSRILGINGVFWAGFTANIAIGIAAFRYLHTTVNKMKAETSFNHTRIKESKRGETTPTTCPTEQQKYPEKS